MTTSSLADIFSPDTYAQAVPHETFEVLRREDPVHWQEEPDGGPGYWALMKYDDVVQVSSDNELFSSWRGGTNIGDMPEDGMSMIRTIMLNMDPPMHTKYRKLVATGFTPKMVNAMRPHVQEITRGIVDRVIEKGECDFVTEISAQLPLAVIAEMIGVPPEDQQQVFDWSNKLIGFDDPEYMTTEEQGRIAATEMFMYGNKLALERRANPRDDLVTVLLNAEVDGDRLTEADFDGFFILLTVAGNETTRNLISGGDAGADGAPGTAAADDR